MLFLQVHVFDLLPSPNFNFVQRTARCSAHRAGFICTTPVWDLAAVKLPLAPPSSTERLNHHQSFKDKLISRQVLQLIPQHLNKCTEAKLVMSFTGYKRIHGWLDNKIQLSQEGCEFLKYRLGVWALEKNMLLTEKEELSNMCLL